MSKTQQAKMLALSPKFRVGWLNDEVRMWMWKILWEFVTAIDTNFSNNVDRSWGDLNIWLSLTQVMNASLKALEGSSKKASTRVVVYTISLYYV